MNADPVRLGIVIPTRNRADLAPMAIRSVLAVSGLDLAILVSDNSSDPDEAEKLRRLCLELDDERLSYVRPPTSLAMTDHWNWAIEHLLSRRDVSHVTFLTDRSLFQPGALKDALKVVEARRTDVVTYVFDTVDDFSTPVRLYQKRWTGRVIRIPSRRMLDLAADMQFLRVLPRMLNCIVPAGTVRALHDRFGTVFGSTSPDYSFALRCLCLVDAIYYYDRPCFIQHSTGRSTGMSSSRGKPSAESVDFMTTSKVKSFHTTPLPQIMTISNALAHEYCAVRKEVGEDGLKPLNLSRYLHALSFDLETVSDAVQRAQGYELLRSMGWNDYVRTKRSLRERLISRAKTLQQKPRSAGILLEPFRWRLKWIACSPMTKRGWLLLNRLGIYPPAEQRFRFASKSAALEYASRFPRRRTNSFAHLREILDSPEVVRSAAVENAGSDARSRSR